MQTVRFALEMNTVDADAHNWQLPLRAAAQAAPTNHGLRWTVTCCGLQRGKTKS